MARKRKRRDYDDEEKPGRLEQLRIRGKALLHFLSYDIWRQNPETLSNKRNILYNATKTVILTVRNIQELDIAASSRSLTFRTLFSIVPLLAVIFAIARGFGIENIMESSIFNFMLGNVPDTEMTTVPPVFASDSSVVVGIDEFAAADRVNPDGAPAMAVVSSADEEDATADGRTREFLDLLFKLINNSLEEAKGGGIFAGIGILLFLYTIILLFGDIEKNLNKIWRVTEGKGG